MAFGCRLAIGCRLGEGLWHTGESQWAVLRDQIAAQHHTNIKPEIREVDVDAIYFTQKSCSGHFRGGRSLTQLVEGLRDGSFHPLQDDFLILNVEQAESDYRYASSEKIVYYSLDNRRAKCLKDASCETTRVRVLLCDDAVSDLINKAYDDHRPEFRVRR